MISIKRNAFRSLNISKTWYLWISSSSIVPNCN